MKVTFVDEELYDYRFGLTIKIDGEKVFSVYDGEPEDNSLERNFSDCHNIEDMMKRAYEAGKAGEPFEVERVEEKDEDL